MVNALRGILEKEGYREEFPGAFPYLLAGEQGAPGSTGAMGAQGAPGNPGPAGRDAYDKFYFDPDRETFLSFTWKGVDFTCPLDHEIAKSIQTGNLNYGDLAFIRVAYGEAVVRRMSKFWRRAYEEKEDFRLFINEEDECHLVNIDKLNSYPDPLQGS